ncbi:bifunctional metallophosphatase/5'-nucleotidase [Kurthia massiliensis]|uniref:bifunctional metallophosphatase/5'-nucleotidase n=1 Tax=Kurthia massiliensis TaxID=1033739 RepID=UPI000288917B|nr:bifunctional UDP-sugar hydrolase/5'-nucleotidase [Kurthia massiliensis]
MFQSKLFVSLTATAALLCATSQTAEAKTTAKNVPIQILGINDLNGYIDSTYQNPASKTIGGMSSLAYNLSTEKSQFAKQHKLASTNTNSISVHTGDVFGGRPAISGLLQDHPTISVLNAMNFKIGVVGNHELNEGLDEFLRVIQGKKPTYDTPNYDLVNHYNIEKSKAVTLGANVINKKTKKIVNGFKPYEIKTINGVKVGFIGIVDPYVEQLIMRQHMKNIDITNPAKAIAKYDKVLRKKGVKAIVVLAHAGAENTGNKQATIETQGTSEKAQLSGSVTTIIDQLDKIAPNHSVDMIFGGHSHTFANAVYGKNNIRVVESLDYGKSYNVATGTINTKTKDFVKTPTATVKYNYTRTSSQINKNSVAKKVDSIVKNAAQLTGTVTRAKIATMNTATLSSQRPTKSIGGTPVGNLVADSQKALAQKVGSPVDFAFTNSGGVRDDLIATMQNGKQVITWEAAQKVQPFSNFLHIGTLTGKQIKAVLNEQFSGGRGLEVAGLHYTYNDKGVIDVFVGDETSTKKIKSSATYSVILNDFLQGGGDNFNTFKKLQNDAIVGIDTDAFIDYLKEQKTITDQYTSRNTYINN